MLNINDIGNGSLSNAVGTDADAVASVMAEIGSNELRMVMARAVERAVGDTGATMDIVQDALVLMIEHASTFDWTKGSIVGWGCRIACNAARNWRKASANRGHESETTVGDEGEAVALVDTLPGPDGRHEAARLFERSALAAAILTLDADAQTFLDAMAGGMGQTEAGALVGWSPATSTRRYKAIAAHLSQRI